MIFNINSTKLSSQANPLFTYLQKQRENQKFIKLLEIGGTFFLISFFTFFAIKPTFLTISSLLGDIKSKELLTKELKTKINDVILAQDMFSQVQEKYSLIDSSLPINPRFYQANSQVVGLSKNNQIIIDKISYLVHDQNYFSTSISTSSSFPLAVSLISSILQNRRLTGIDNFTISLDKDNQGQKIIIDLPLKIYYWPNDTKK